MLMKRCCRFPSSLHRWFNAGKSSALTPELCRTWMRQGAALIGETNVNTIQVLCDLTESFAPVDLFYVSFC